MLPGGTKLVKQDRAPARPDGVGRSVALGRTRASFGSAAFNMERQSVLNHYAPQRAAGLGAWPGAFLGEQSRPRN